MLLSRTIILMRPCTSYNVIAWKYHLFFFLIREKKSRKNRDFGFDLVQFREKSTIQHYAIAAMPHFDH